MTDDDDDDNAGDKYRNRSKHNCENRRSVQQRRVGFGRGSVQSDRHRWKRISTGASHC